MRKLLSFLSMAVLCLINTGKTESYVFSALSNGTPVRWNLTSPNSPIVQNGRVVYNLNPAGSADVPFSQVETAIANSFKVWEDLPNSTIAFTRGPNRSETTGGHNDGIFQLYWNETSTTDDGLDITGALGVTRLSIYSNGEISDASIVFNGVEAQWATDGSASRVDIAEVATHEIGHAFGLSHSPVGAATMFPRTTTGSLHNRSLSQDDEIAAAVLYPANGFLNQTGTLRGVVRAGGSAMFGANVVATDGNGNVVATALTQRDGSYRIQGLPPGNYTAFVEPIDAAGGLLYGVDDLSSYYASANTDFQTSSDVAVSLGAGAETVQDFSVTRGNAALNIQLIYNPAYGGFSNLAVSVQPGQTTTIGVGGPGLPTSGNSFSVSGSGITITRLRFGTLSNNSGNAILADVVISPSAAPGPRNLIVTGNGQRSVAVGALEIEGSTTLTLSNVSGANYEPNVAAESIVAAFGNSLATNRVTATTSPLPTSLGGTTVVLRDSAGNVRNAPLFYVSSTQINYQIAPGILPGLVTITVTNSLGQISTGTLQVLSVAPGLFSAAGSGSGAAAALALRVKPSGAQSYEPVARFDSATGKFVTVPIDLGIAGDQVFLVLYGTGFRFRSSLGAVVVTVGGVSQQVTYAGKQGGQVGLDQLNVRLDSNLAKGERDVLAIVDGRTSNIVRVNLK